MSLYAEYMSERGGFSVLLADDGEGFIAYKIRGDECFIHDFFVSRASRRKLRGALLLQALEDKAREEGCTYLSGNIWVKAPNSSGVIAAALRVGFEIIEANNNGVLVQKSLGVSHG